MRINTWDVVSLSLLGLTSGLTGLVYGRLPEQVATHFDIHGTPNGWMPRAMAAAFLPIFGLVMWAITRFAYKLVRDEAKRAAAAGPMPFIAALTTLFLCAIHCLILRVAVKPDTDIMRPLMVMLGLFFVVLGLVMPRIRRNPVVGVRTFWTIQSPEVWARTQRVGGYALVVSGATCVLLGLVGGPSAMAASIVVLFGSSIVPVVYSFFAARAEKS
ncbi:MAG: SdpI family protein [Myxococcales bacterium]|jgi:uncharacterized membrane protein|nr:SdpI family protein [Myxococcales bacterium]